MTPKESLEVLVNNLDQAKLKELSSSEKYWTKYEEVNEAINVLESIILYEEVMKDEWRTIKRHKTNAEL